jgi:hypothetical protein
MENKFDPERLPWRLVEMWPANGIPKGLRRWKIAAVHIPATTHSREKILIKRGRYIYEKVKIMNKWSRVEVIG